MLLSLSACASDGGSSGDDPGVKTGGDAEPLKITAVDGNWDGSPSGRALTEFESQVESRSQGSLEVDTIHQYPEAGRNTDSAVLEALIDGEVQMAMVPARAWS